MTLLRRQGQGPVYERVESSNRLIRLFFSFFNTQSSTLNAPCATIPTPTRLLRATERKIGPPGCVDRVDSVRKTSEDRRCSATILGYRRSLGSVATHESPRGCAYRFWRSAQSGKSTRPRVRWRTCPRMSLARRCSSGVCHLLSARGGGLMLSISRGKKDERGNERVIKRERNAHLELPHAIQCLPNPLHEIFLL